MLFLGTTFLLSAALGRYKAMWGPDDMPWLVTVSVGWREGLSLKTGNILWSWCPCFKPIRNSSGIFKGFWVFAGLHWLSVTALIWLKPLMDQFQLQPQYFFQTSVTEICYLQNTGNTDSLWFSWGKEHLLGLYLVLVWCLCAFIRLIFITTLWGRYYYYLPLKMRKLTEKAK